jgi:hypothetical protein
MTAQAPVPLRSHRLRNALIVTVILAGVGVVSFVVPMPHSFSYQLSPTPSSASHAPFTPPAGSRVSGSWSCSPATGCGFDILGSDGRFVVFTSNSSGSFSFTATSLPYTFTVLTTNSSAILRVTGTYWCPLLPYTSYDSG